jgi:hypothetical protein
MLGLAKMAAKMAAKKTGKQTAKEADEIPDYSKNIKAAEAAAKKRDIAEKVAIGAGTVAAMPIAAKMGSLYGEQLNERGNRIKEDAEKSQKQYEAQDKQEGRGMKKGGKVKASSASKRADGIAVKGKTRGRII